MRISRTLLLAGAAGAAVLLVAPLTAAAASASLTAAFAQTSVWSSGYGAEFTVANRGDAAASGWVVEFDLPAGSTVSGNVASVTPAGKVKGVASIGIRFNRITARGDNHSILSDFVLTAPSSKKKDAAKIGIGAAAGAVIGAIAGGGKGAAIGAAVGGGAGTGYVMMTAGEEIEIKQGAPITTTLDRALEVKVPIK